MRGKRAKAIRRVIYEEMSIRQRGYVIETHVKGTKKIGEKVIKIVSRTLHADGLRRRYQQAKRAWNRRARA